MKVTETKTWTKTCTIHMFPRDIEKILINHFATQTDKNVFTWNADGTLTFESSSSYPDRK
jgi:hypothetical protein